MWIACAALACTMGCKKNDKTVDESAETTAAKVTDDSIAKKAEAAGAKEEIVEEQTESVHSLSKAEDAAVVNAARAGLDYVRDARQAIAEKNQKQASDAVMAAAAELTKARSLLPAIRVRDTIWSARNGLLLDAYEDSVADLVQVEDAIDESVDMAAAAPEAKKRIAAARGHVQKAQKKQAQRELEVLDVTVGRTGVFLPVLPASQHLYAAEAEVFFGDLTAADRELAAVENELVVIRDEVIELPATQLTRQLQAASTAHQAKDDAGTHLHLQAAGSLLRTIERDAATLPDFLKKEVSTLSAEIKAADEDRDRESTAARLKRVEARAQGLLDGWMQKLVATEHRVGQEALIEARMNTEFAIQDLHEGREAVAPRLDSAIAALERAEGHVAEDANQGISTALQAARKAKQEVGDKEVSDSEFAATLSSINAELFALIHKIAPHKRATAKK